MRNRYVLVADVLLVGMVAFLAFALRFDLHFLSNRDEFLPFLYAALTVKPVVFFLFGLYRRFWRYASLQDMLSATLAVATASTVLAVGIGLAVGLGVLPVFSRAVLLMDAMATLVAVCGVRATVRLVGETRSRSRESTVTGELRKVLVVGAGDAGALVVREMQRNPQLGMSPVGFMDDDARKIGKKIYGVPIFGPLVRLGPLADAARVDEIIIAMPRSSGAELRKVTELCQGTGIRVRTIPGVFELLGDRVSINRLRKVEITDLLRRAQIDLSVDRAQYLAGSTVMVTGAGGSIGMELCRQVAHGRPRRLILLGHGENSIFDAHVELREACPDVEMHAIIADIRDRSRLNQIFEVHRPTVVFHAAAHKHVPLMEANPAEAVTNNIIGTQNVVDAAIRSDTLRFVLISTDKAVAPTCVMGASKRVAEFIVSDAAARTGRGFVVVRFGNVLGSRGSVVPLFNRQIERGGPVTVTHPEMRRFFMTIPEAVHLVVHAGGLGRGGELFVLNMGDPVRIVELAQDLIKLSGYTTDEILIEFTGMRPGEKLTEALWEPDAVPQTTAHSEILMVKDTHALGGERLASAVKSLADAAASDDRLAITAILAQSISSFVPEWQPR